MSERSGGFCPQVMAAKIPVVTPQTINRMLPAFGMRRPNTISASEFRSFVNTFAGAGKSQLTIVPGIQKNVMQSACAEENNAPSCCLPEIML